MRFFWVRDRQKQGQYHVYWRKGKGNKADYFSKHHPVAHHRNVRPYYVYNPDNPTPYYEADVNYFAPLMDDDDDTVATEPETDSEAEDDLSDDEMVQASNCSQQSISSVYAGEGVLKAQSHGTSAPSSAHHTVHHALASSGAHDAHNIS